MPFSRAPATGCFPRSCWASVLHCWSRSMTSSRNSLSLKCWMSVVEIGSLKTIASLLGRGNRLCLGQASYEPSMAKGTNNGRLRRTRATKPGLRGPISPSAVRVPSGKTNTASPWLSSLMVSRRPASVVPTRPTGIAPNDRMNQPKGPTKSVSRARQRIRLGHFAAIAIGSK